MNMYFVLTGFLLVNLVVADDSSAPLTIEEELLFVTSHMMPSAIYNTSCVAQDCPLATTNKCPDIRNVPSMIRMLSTFNSCATRRLCGFVMDPDVVPVLTFSTQGLLGFGNLSACSILPGGYLENIAHARVVNVSVATRQQLVLNMIMPDLVVFGYMNCDCNVVNMTFYHLMTFTYTLTVNQNSLTVTNPHFHMLNNTYDYLSTSGQVLSSYRNFSEAFTEQIGVDMQFYFANFTQAVYYNIYQLALANC